MSNPMDFYTEYDSDYYTRRPHISKKHMMKYLKQLCPKSSMRLLDVGCGVGYYLKDAIDEGFDAYGIDISEYAINNPLPEVVGKTRLGGITDIPFGPDQFDVITAFDVIEHIHPRDTEKALIELYRVLKPDGILILTTPSGFYGEWVKDLTHINVRPPKYWKIMFTKAGFKLAMPYLPSFLKYFFGRFMWIPDKLAFKLEEPIRFFLGHYYVRKGRLYMLARK